MDTREEGVAYLAGLDLNRDDLRRLVAALDLPATRSDNTDRLRARVAEALIGYRLRSQAIRGTAGTTRTDPIDFTANDH
jgi:hypothetical protein